MPPSERLPSQVVIVGAKNLAAQARGQTKQRNLVMGLASGVKAGRVGAGLVAA